MRPLVVVALVACSQAVPPIPHHHAMTDAAIDAPADAVVDAPPPLPNVPYALLDRDQKMRFMKEVLTPEMAVLFRAFDPVKFAKFDCVTCHPSSSQFVMPDPKLPHLDTGKHDPRFVDWMMKTVQPAVARLLRDKETDCARCHVGEFR